MVRIHQVLLLGMLFQIGAKEGARRDDLDAPLSSGSETGLDECGSQALPAMIFRNERVIEADRTRQQIVGSENEFAATNADLEPVLIDIIADDRVCFLHLPLLARRAQPSQCKVARRTPCIFQQRDWPFVILRSTGDRSSNPFDNGRSQLCICSGATEEDSRSVSISSSGASAALTARQISVRWTGARPMWRRSPRPASSTIRS